MSDLLTECSLSPVSSQLFDSTSLDHIKTFKTERPVNSAAISPIMDHVSKNLHVSKKCAHFFSTWSTTKSSHLYVLVFQVVMGGGQEAMEVTTTSTRIGKFEAR